MAFKDEEVQEQQFSQNINDTENTAVDPVDDNNNTVDTNSPIPPDVNDKGEVVRIQTKTIEVGNSECYAPTSHEELDELISKEVIKEKHKDLFVFKYETWHGELPKTATGSEEDEKQKEKVGNGLIDINSLLPELNNSVSPDQDISPKIDLNSLLEEDRTKTTKGTNLENGGSLAPKTLKEEVVFKDTPETQTNSTIPKALKEKVEQLSGVLLDDVVVHYNSLEPFKFNANAITRGNEIFLAPGQEACLEEELWHVVQQKQGLVKPTGTENGEPVSESPSMERTAKAGQPQQGQTKQNHQEQELVQKNDDKLTFLVKVKGKLTGRELIILIENQIYGETIGSSWSINAVDVDPTATFGKEGQTITYHVSIPAAKYQYYRSKSATAKGVELDENEKVKGAEKRSAELESLPKATQDALIEEINRRFQEASGKTKKEKGDEALWNVYRDEVLAQREKVMNLSDKAKQLVKTGEEGGLVIAPKDYPRMIQMLEKIEQMDSSLVAEYASRISGKATSIEQMEQSVDDFVKKQATRVDNKKERTAIENELFATEGLFDDLQTYRSLAIGGGISMGSGLASLEYYNDLSKEVKKYGFKDLDDYSNKIDDYLASFQQESVATGIGLLQKYEHFLYEEEQRYLSTADAKQLGDAVAQSGAKENYEKSQQNASNAAMASMAMGTTTRTSDAVEKNIQGYRDKSKEQKEAADKAMKGFDKDHPLLKDPAFNLEKLSQQSPEDTKAFLLAYIQKQRENIAQTKAKMEGDKEFVFTLDNLMQHMYQQEGITKGSIQDKALQDHIGGIKLKDTLISVGIALLAIGLGLVSGGGGTVGVMAAVGGAALSVYDVTREFGKYADEKAAHDVGLLSKDPSFAWVILAMVGAGLDFAAVAKLLTPLKVPVEGFNELVKTDPVKALSELDKKLNDIAEIDAKLKANILKRAENKAAYKKAKAELKGITRVELIPYSTELFTWAVYAVKDGITRVDDFFRWLKKEEIIKSISKEGLSTDELKALQISLKQAQDNIAFVDNVLTPNLAKRLSAEPQRFVSLGEKFNEEEVLKLVNAGKGANLTDLEIEDIILNACRKNKDFDVNEVIQQMSTWAKVQKQGFPTIFENLEDFQKFSATVKSLAKKWDLPADSIIIQGSSLRVEDVSKIGDLDVSIIVDQKTFDELVERFKNNVKSGKVEKRIGNNGKIGGNDMFNGGPSLVRDFYDSFKTVFGVEFPVKLGVPKIQISVIEKGSKLGVSPFLELK